ncbi:SEL1-like repeat protein [Aestuariirhabdus litorea]|uniref:Peptidoglycan binding-like domain-containing protein n=1 Tax=Aestuariirhabdus litorea TaxID=2528527 RepID=A0A3P3VJE0_9GAMM|nr:SEL1-like repeat protein [Aestuariirhabdus litorea]RRJ82484.1 hypothetical protein D0544_11460 [Aestuariirhabdus litorea]RWW92645.1 hypothetical protein DZC74_11435 [Endozoicomonadaceae bacterium GTF-13]
MEWLQANLRSVAALRAGYRALLLPLVLLIAGCAPVSQLVAPPPDAAKAEAAYQEGARYSVGAGVEQDYGLALKHYREAARYGSVPGSYMVGMSFYTGRGVQVDYAEARRWLLKAAEGGYARAQYQLGKLYLDGLGGAKDAAWGARWIGMAAYQGHARAQFAYGIAWSQGLGLPQDTVRGLSWLIRADNQKLAEAAEVRRSLAKGMNAAQRAQAQAEARKSLPYNEGLNNLPTRLFVQQRLTEKGYNPGAVDGLLGTKTGAALMQFQGDAGIAVSGEVDEATLNQLRDLYFWQPLLN